MKKEFAPYEQSLELKELGFDEPCFGWFRSTLIPSNFTEYFLETEFGMNESPSDWVNSNFLDKACSAPLYQQAFRWFREKYNLDSSMSRDVWNTYSTTYRITGGVKGIVEANSHGALYDIDSKDYDSYEEAELECLKKLIEIVKEQK